MRYLFVIPHYVRDGGVAPKAEERTETGFVHPTLSRVAKVAALGDTLAALTALFGTRRMRLEGVPIPQPHKADIVVVTKSDGSILRNLDYRDAISEVIEHDGDAALIPWACQRVLQTRQGAYDYYCYLEDDIIIHDPAFFEKLAWFERTFGSHALLQPVPYEISRTGVPAKISIAPVLDEAAGIAFLRDGQRRRLDGDWHGRPIGFEIPHNPHGASFFLSARQLDMLIAHPSYGVRDASWIDPMVSAATLTIGKVFDLYKAVEPDLFFLEVEHYGSRYAGRFAPFEIRYGDEPLLAIAEAALRELGNSKGSASGAKTEALLELARSVGGSTARQAIEERALGVIFAHRTQFEAERDQVRAERDRIQTALDQVKAEMAQDRAAHQTLRRSPRELSKALLGALLRRAGL